MKEFPPVESADEIGLLAVGGDLEPNTILSAYSNGIFLWPYKNAPLLWFAPPKRAILFFDELHVTKSLKKFANKSKYTFKINGDFKNVMMHCSRSKTRKERGTWILPEMIEPYTELFKRGYGFCVETLDDGELAGGLFGIKIGRAYMGESMFYLKPNASKLALLHLIDHLKEQNITWLDCEVLNPIFEGFGAREIERAEFMKMLNEAKA